MHKNQNMPCFVLFALYAVLVVVAACVLWQALGNPHQHTHQTRTIDGIATAKYIRAETDTADMEIQTSDGQKWLVTDYILPINTPVQMTFDTHGTADPADDTILQIVSTTNF